MRNQRNLFLFPTDQIDQRQQQNHPQHDFYLHEKMEEETCWRTNLMLDSEIERVNERNNTFKKRTSFEENLVNNHLQAMKAVLQETGLQISKCDFPSSDKAFSSLRQKKEIEVIDSNTYLSEQQKWELREVVLGNQQNFSVLMRLSCIFQENKQELIYLLCKILHYSTVSMECKAHQRLKIKIAEAIEDHKLKIVDAILNQQTIKVVSPLFFSNINEQPFMHILYVWFYNILSIKNGIYECDSEEGNLFAE